jgi:hypothetical protein
MQLDQPTVSLESECRKLVASYYRAIQNLSVEAMLACCSDDVLVTFPEAVRNWRGLALAKEKFSSFLQTPNLSTTFEISEVEMLLNVPLKCNVSVGQLSDSIAPPTPNATIGLIATTSSIPSEEDANNTSRNGDRTSVNIASEVVIADGSELASEEPGRNAAAAVVAVVVASVIVLASFRAESVLNPRKLRYSIQANVVVSVSKLNEIGGNTMDARRLDSATVRVSGSDSSSVSEGLKIAVIEHL